MDLRNTCQYMIFHTGCFRDSEIFLNCFSWGNSGEEMGQVTMTENDALTTAGDEREQHGNVTPSEKNGSFLEATSLFHSSSPGLC